MTTNLNAVAGPSKLPTSPLVEIESPTQSADSPPNHHGSMGRESGVSKPGLSVDENGEVVKVPAFLNKLFSMVSDTTTDALIYWADSGDSFFVPNHEQFGKELLPRFFKHSNFSSFVRQLNMYGFHKVPHLQSGVLKNEAPSELWEFVNPFFKRNHPELLSKVTRKNNRPGMAGQTLPTSSGSTGTRQSARQAAGQSVVTPGGHSVHLITDGTTEGEAGQLVGPTGQALDLSAIASHLTAIRQAQSTLTADLQALKASNDHLWRETLEAKEKHQTHEETMNLIISFLERLFGTEGEGLRGLKEALRRAGISGPSQKRDETNSGSGEEQQRQKRKRLAIADGSGDDINATMPGSNDQTNHLFPWLSRSKSRPNVQSGQPQYEEEEPWSSSSQRFQPISGDDESVPSTAGTTRSNPTPTPLPEQTLAQATLSPMSDTDTMRATDMNALARYNYPQNPNLQNGSQGQHGLDPASLSNQAQGFGHGQQYNQNHSQNQTNHSQTQNAGPLSPRSTAAAASAYNLDPSILQTTIGSLLQSPAAAQMFLNSLNNSVQGQTLTTPLGQSMLNGQSSYPFPSPHQQQPQSQSQLPPFSTNSQNDHQDPTLALFSPLPNQEALMQHTDNLQRSYQGAADMSGDVDKLQESIDSLVRSMGLEPNPSTSNPALGTGVGSVGGNAGMGDGGSGETMMDDANGFNLGGMGGGDEGFDTNFDVDQFLTELARSERQIQDQGQMQGQGQGQGQGQVQEDRKPQV